ncbi:MAG: energy transducer TonB, partial [Calditrichaeota bacterium]
SGRIIEAKIVRSSGFPSIDRDCLAVFDRIKSFPPLPDDFRDEIIGITLTIKY